MKLYVLTRCSTNGRELNNYKPFMSISKEEVDQELIRSYTEDIGTKEDVFDYSLTKGEGASIIFTDDTYVVYTIFEVEKNI